MVREVFAESEIVSSQMGKHWTPFTKSKKLHSRNSATRLLFLRQLTMVREVFAESEIDPPYQQCSMQYLPYSMHCQLV
jgi:hypothetical protein